MKHDYTSVQNIYIICGKTDMRKGIDGLATLIQDSFKLDPYSDSIFLFSGWSKDREGDAHPITGIPFERTEIEYAGETISGVYPVFESEFTAQLQSNQYLLSDTEHEKIANGQLYSAIEQNPSLQTKLGLTQTEINNLQFNQTPEGYTWHHHEQPGQMQLVDSSIHDQTAHTGGRYIWGGGSSAR